MKTAQEILNDPFINKGTAFTLEERKALNLVGFYYLLLFRHWKSKQSRPIRSIRRKFQIWRNESI